MTTMMRVAAWALAIVALSGAAPDCRADFVTYTFSGRGTGALGTLGFTDTAFTITVTSDTDLVTPFSFVRNGFTNNGFSISPSPTTITLAGGAMVDFTGGEKVFVNNSTGVLGLQRPSNSDLLNLPRVPPFDTYDLRSSLGPIFVASPTAVNQFRDVQTSAGLLGFSNIVDVTFQANVIPEPSSLALCGVALAGLGAWARRRAA